MPVFNRWYGERLDKIAAPLAGVDRLQRMPGKSSNLRLETDAAVTFRLDVFSSLMSGATACFQKRASRLGTDCGIPSLDHGFNV